MRIHFILLTFVLFLVTDVSMAIEAPMPERLVADLDKSKAAATGLSEIVDLCAKEQEEKFQKKWRTYVTQNGLKGAELEDTIDWVSSEAALQRESHKGTNGDKKADEAWKAKRKKLMAEIARKAMNPVY